MKHWLLFLFLLSFGGGVYAQSTVQMDTAYVEARNFDQNALKALKQERDFQYNNLQEPAMSWWDRFWNWFWYNVNQLLRTRQGKTTLWTLFIVFGVAMISFFVMKVTGMSKDGLFGRSSGSGLNYTTSSEDIHNILFDEAIEEAIAAGNYRLATRLLYLQALKRLSDKGYIQWQINKTNTDYVFEVISKPWHPLFSMLTTNFEYAWYGEASVGRDRFFDLRNQFQQFNKQL